ncbi:unnamed protein product [Rotaria sp. Silwood2]|nr:unnamed protein product [Rotaria sp. Silwood2]
MKAVGATQSVSDYLDRKPMQKTSSIIQLHELQGDIEFDNASLISLRRPNNHDETKMFQPADQVNLHGFISELINEYNTKCAQRGQKQRVLTAPISSYFCLK